jgi:hypothetical protein
MRNLATKWGLISIGAILALLALTNPSNKSYTEYLRTNRYKTEPYSYKTEYLAEYECSPFYGKRNNYILFSTFKYEVDTQFIAPPLTELETELAKISGKHSLINRSAFSELDLSKVVFTPMTKKESAESQNFNTRYYKNHLGILSNFIILKPTKEKVRK